MPIRKKGERIEYYRGVTVAPALYKIYVSIFWREAREGEVEEKNLVPQNQTGFRKGMGTMDNVYVLNYLINRQPSRGKRKMMTFFVNLKAMFDSKNKEILGREMRKRGVKEELVRRCENIFRKTRNRVRIRGK